MKKTYSEKLLDPRWQRRRLEIMERDDFACQVCSDKTETLNVHHRYYVSGREPWDYPGFALITLCRTCHSQEGVYEGQPVWAMWEQFLDTFSNPNGYDINHFLHQFDQKVVFHNVSGPCLTRSIARFLATHDQAIEDMIQDYKANGDAKL